ncbi:ribonuclease H-like domain-containing protein [Gamsiella multidivaricata]|uniref:ribonuclease H-like domain-containing protein n=1 Tax=Gamsiella multidivaricata TaxID=101098 RepID=UPI00221EA59C|nr:ribonuclease H-like domain-containing protein [Gamsiella multidivaricata]KAI7824628.1 ribonuclease H-like domain-containing protein [Gamsiella multidivaricata]
MIITDMLLFTTLDSSVLRELLGHADSWSSRSNKPYLDITLHWIDNDFNALECTLEMIPQPYPHTISATARLIRGIIGPANWNIQEAITSATTNSAPVMQKTTEILGMPRFPCVMAQALQQEQELINRDVPPVIVIMGVVIRWNSTLLMLQRLLKLKVTIESLQFTPFEDMTLVFSSTSSGLAAYVAPRVVGLLNELEKEDIPHFDALNQFWLEFIAKMETRPLISDAYLLASALHPTFNTLWFLEDEERFKSIKGKLREEFKQVAPNSPKCNMNRHLTKKKDKMIYLGYTSFSSGDNSRKR